MTLDYKQSIKLMEVLDNNGFPEMAHEIEAQLAKKDIFTGRLTEMRYCEHSWQQMNYQSVKQIVRLDNMTEEDIENLKKNWIKCEKCGLPYRCKSVNMSLIAHKWENSFEDNIKIDFDINGPILQDVLSKIPGMCRQELDDCEVELARIREEYEVCNNEGKKKALKEQLDKLFERFGSIYNS